MGFDSEPVNEECIDRIDRGRGLEMNEPQEKRDWITMLLSVLLVATLLAYFMGAFPYPYGWIVLSVMLVFRLTARDKKID